MATKVLTRLVDDVDGGEADETVAFALDGAEYEIDLSKTNADMLRKAVGEYAAHARKVGGREKKQSFNGVDSGAVRAWARSNHIDLSARGRIPKEVIQKYRAAGH